MADLRERTGVGNNPKAEKQVPFDVGKCLATDKHANSPKRIVPTLLGYKESPVFGGLLELSVQETEKSGGDRQDSGD